MSPLPPDLSRPAAGHELGERWEVALELAPQAVEVVELSLEGAGLGGHVGGGGEGVGTETPGRTPPVRGSHRGVTVEHALGQYKIL